MSLRSGSGWGVAAAIAAVATFILLLKPERDPPPNVSLQETEDGTQRLNAATIQTMSPTVTLMGLELNDYSEVIDFNSVAGRTPASVSDESVTQTVNVVHRVPPVMNSRVTQGEKYTVPPFIPYGDLPTGHGNPLQGLFWTVQNAVMHETSSNEARLTAGNPWKVLRVLQGDLTQLELLYKDESPQERTFLSRVARFVASSVVTVADAGLKAVGFSGGVESFATTLTALVAAGAATAIGYYLKHTFIGLAVGVAAAYFIYNRQKVVERTPLPRSLPYAIRQWNEAYPQYKDKGGLFMNLEPVRVLGAGQNQFFFVDPNDLPVEPISGRQWFLWGSPYGPYKLRTMSARIDDVALIYPEQVKSELKYSPKAIAVQIYSVATNTFGTCYFHVPGYGGPGESVSENAAIYMSSQIGKLWHYWFANDDVVTGALGSYAYCMPGSYHSMQDFERKWALFVSHARDLGFTLELLYPVLREAAPDETPILPPPGDGGGGDVGGNGMRRFEQLLSAASDRRRNAGTVAQSQPQPASLAYRWSRTAGSQIL